MTEDEMFGSHCLRDTHEFEQALGVGGGQGSLMSCIPWGRKCHTRLSAELNRTV